MTRPDNMPVYDELDLKLGIKSSLPNPKATVGLALLIYESMDAPATVQYCVPNGDGLVVEESVLNSIITYSKDIFAENEISSNDVELIVNRNQLFKSQFEALVVAFELVWKICKVSFVDKSKPASAERTGGIRYPKQLAYSSNCDIIHCAFVGDKNEYTKVLLSWIGFNVDFNDEYQQSLLRILTAFAENAVFKMTDGLREIIFNQLSVYRKLYESGDSVDINGDHEAKGPLRILKSLLADGMNPYLSYSNNGNVSTSTEDDTFSKYLNRVETFLRLSATKVVGIDDLAAETEGIVVEELEERRLTTGTNILLYGVPGSGKSWTIQHEYCTDDSIVERLVFHPDYTYSDFVGQILPDVDDQGLVTYKYTPGPFTTILRDAYADPTHKYILVIEEINRGNAPAIFGEVFQLLDRKVEQKDEDDGYPVGTSEYGITNPNMASIIYGDRKKKVRIPSNLSIIGTMNTSDQNVFTLDTAFQRRWKMRLIENSFENVRPSLANCPILDTGVTWRHFCEVINKQIVGNKAKMASSEDKRLGVYFVHESDLRHDNCDEPKDHDTILAELNVLLKAEMNKTITSSQKTRLNDIRTALIQNRIFPEKVIKYLWDDAFKFNTTAIFDTEENKDLDSLEAVIRMFVFENRGRDRFRIFKSAIRDLLFES